MTTVIENRVHVRVVDGAIHLTAQPGVRDFLGLSDTPATYSGQGGKVVAVKSDASGLEFVVGGGGAGVMGSGQ